MESDFYKKNESVEQYIKLAKDVNGKELIIQLKDYLPLGSSLLELGSDPCSDWRILSEDYKTTGSN